MTRFVGLSVIISWIGGKLHFHASIGALLSIKGRNPGGEEEGGEDQDQPEDGGN